MSSHQELPPTVENFKGIGVFHFGEYEKREPIKSLLSALDRCSSAFTDFLIVLPESFNRPGGYWSEVRPDPSIKCKLIELYQERKVAFVVGLIEDREAGPRCNVAYLLDGAPNGKRDFELTWKFCELESMGTRSPHFCSTPVDHRGFAIAALICNDFIDCPVECINPRKEELAHGRKKLLADLSRIPSTRKVVCVPACSSHWE